MTTNIAITAFKNISRNRRRSILSGAAICVAAMSIVILFAIMAGLTKDMESNLLNFYVGDVNIKNIDYDKYERFNPVHLTVNLAEAEAAISATDGIEAWSARTMFPTNIYINESNFGALGVGIDFLKEKDYFDFGTTLKEGRLPQSGKNEMIIGSALASNLKLKTGDKVTIMSMTASRGTNAMTLEITGIAVLPVAALNASNFWMPLDRVQHFLQTPGAVQQILIKTSGGVKSKDAAAALSDRFSADGTPVDVKEMKDGSTIYGFMQMAEMIYNVVAVFFFVLGSTVIINTTMMVIFERMREIGTLSALGMQGSELTRLFLLEGTFISAIGALTGVAIGVVITLYLGRTGINFTDAMQGIDMEMSSIWYPQLNVPKTIFVYFYAVIIASLATLIPSRKASRIQPVEALKYI